MYLHFSFIKLRMEETKKLLQQNFSLQLPHEYQREQFSKMLRVFSEKPQDSCLGEVPEWKMVNPALLSQIEQPSLRILDEFSRKLKKFTLANAQQKWNAFISFQGGDREIVLDLVAKLGVEDIFIDANCISLGRKLDEYIAQSLKGSSCLIVFLSPNLISRGGYACTEIKDYFREDQNRLCIVIVYNLSVDNLLDEISERQIEPIYKQYLQHCDHFSWNDSEHSNEGFYEKVRCKIPRQPIQGNIIRVDFTRIGMIALDKGTKEFSLLFANYSKEHHPTLQVRILGNAFNSILENRILAAADIVFFLFTATDDHNIISEGNKVLMDTIQKNERSEDAFAFSAICLCEVEQAMNQISDLSWSTLFDYFCFQPTKSEHSSGEQGRLDFIERICQSLQKGKQVTRATAKPMSQIVADSQEYYTAFLPKNGILGIPIDPYSEILPHPAICQNLMRHLPEDEIDIPEIKEQSTINDGEFLEQWGDRVTTICSTDSGFILGLTHPPALVLLDDFVNNILLNLELDTDPLCLYYFNTKTHKALLAVGSLDNIRVFSHPDMKEEFITFFSDTGDSFINPIREGPKTMTFFEDNLWISDGHQIYIYDINSMEWKNPPEWMETLSPIGQLKVVNEQLWGVTHCIPSSIIRLSLTSPKKCYTGHDYEWIAPITDIDCGSDLVTIKALVNDSLCFFLLQEEPERVYCRELYLPELPPQPSPWNCSYILTVPNGTIIARCISSPRYSVVGGAQIAFVPMVEDEKVVILAQIYLKIVSHIAVAGNTLLALLVDKDKNTSILRCNLPISK